MQRKRVLDTALVTVLLLLVGVLAVLRGSQSGSQSFPSTYDTGRAGYAALYDLLRREDVGVSRFEWPVADLPHGGRSVLVLAGDGALDAAAPSKSAREVLMRWVSRGGRLVVLDSRISSQTARALGLGRSRTIRAQRTALAGCAFPPEIAGRARIEGTFGAAFPAACTRARSSLLAVNGGAAGIALHHGAGIIAVISAPDVFDNAHLGQRDNARVAYALFGGAGTVAFDERVHGFAAGRSFWQVLPAPMHAAIALALFAVLLAVVGANLPFAPPYEAAPRDERDSSAYIASVARMLERGGAAQEAVARIAARCERALEPRAAGDERARMLLRELRTIEASPHPGTNDLLQAGRIFARVRKDYGC